LSGEVDVEAVQRVELLMEEFGLDRSDRLVVEPSYEAATVAEDTEDKGHRGVYCGAAILLPDGQVVSGCNSPLLHAASSLVLNALKELAGIPRRIDLLSDNIIASIANLRKEEKRSSNEKRSASTWRRR
jgi:uncharacterized protein (UPF0371 family)